MSKTNPLFEFTRFYKGPGTEPINRVNNAQLLWEYERKWVENEEDRAENHPRVLEYRQDVLPLYNEEDGIPLSLKALLYNRYTHWCGGYALEDDVRDFKDFLYRDYLRTS
ncbi:hypothetical protein Q73A0000_01935 [Kaistella flava (ex Peng et al. 2021)]|uniref:Uncharacterized protein n=1 Tax=Kaistella flava (ex Peng et al. 2021) TaxID=2038776 RepID=A0A7M2Y6Z5_9FLAO|nr:hypothetical protein [Kaistella flava (ex Peng et al. 2021)]QOW09202.1 hypothetical protein Q73A0000_01935 [Kaistella flava (ex Peng et al. 2021)]